MNKKILLFLLLILIPVSQAEPPVTSYWGNVTVDGNLTSNTLVEVVNYVCGGERAAQEYRINVPWEDAASNQAGVKEGETIKFLVNGKLAASRTIDTKGSNNKLDLAVLSSSATIVCKTESGTGGTSSGGGGGSPPSAEPFENILKQESREEMLSRDAPRTYTFSTPELPVSQIVITSNINAGLVTAKVELLKNRSRLLTVDAPGNVNKYLNIWVGSLGFAVPRNIKEGVVKFKVENSWITSNGFADSDIKMLKWNVVEWITLATEKTGSDETYTYFEAKTTSFSPFAISGIKEAAAAPPAAVTAATSAIPETTTTAPTKKATGFGIVPALAGLIVVVLRKRNL